MAPSSLGAPCPNCVCWGARGDSWGVRKPGPGYPLLGGGYWERCFPGTSMVPGGRAGWGGSHSALYPQIWSARTLNTPARLPPIPVSENRRRQPPRGLVPGQQAQMVLGALGPGSRDLIWPPTGPGPTVGQLHGSSLQPPTSHRHPQGSTFQDRPFLSCPPHPPALGTRGGASFERPPPLAQARPAWRFLTLGLVTGWGPHEG